MVLSLTSSNRKNFVSFLSRRFYLQFICREPYSQQSGFQGVTHCFTDKRMKELDAADKDAMVNAGVHVVSFMYLQACLQSATLPLVTDYSVK